MPRVFAAALVATLACSLPARTVFAAPSQTELDAAREAFKLGLEKEKAGDYSGALEQFAITAKVKLTPQVRFHMALCHDRLGHLKLAAAEYDLAAKEAEEKKVAEVQKAAPELAKKARERLAVLTLVWPADGAPKKLTIDTEDTDVAAAGEKGVQVDPGSHVVLATMASGKEVRVEVTVAEKDHKTVELSEPKDEPKDEPPKVDPKPKDEPPPEPPKELPPAKESSSLRTIGLVTGGFGLLSLGLGGVFLAVRASAVRDLEGQCTPDLRCLQSAAPTLDRAKTFTTLSRVAFGVGVVSLGVGAVLFLKGGSEEPPAAAARVRFVPYAPNSTVGVGFEGAF